MDTDEELNKAVARVNNAAAALVESFATPTITEFVQSRELIKAMAEAVGKNLAAYVEVMYPEAIKAASSTFRLSLRNHVYNDIMHVATLHTEADIKAWLAANEAHRKEWLAMYRKMRRDK